MSQLQLTLLSRHAGREHGLPQLVPGPESYNYLADDSTCPSLVYQNPEALSALYWQHTFSGRGRGGYREAGISVEYTDSMVSPKV